MSNSDSASKSPVESFAEKGGLKLNRYRLENGSSEYVSLGHPDKLADYISEYILDRFLERDPMTHYALEVQIKDNFVTIGGEVASNASFRHDEISRFVREAVSEVGYTKQYQTFWGKDNTISCDDLVVEQHISMQSQDISRGVNSGWGDQGIMFGLAVNSPETNYLPSDIYLARCIGKRLYDIRYAGLDIKTQVVFRNGLIRKVIVAIPLREWDEEGPVASYVQQYCGSLENYELIINGTGRYVKHSSMADCGMTGRKLAVDFYGGNCNIGGGSPWTKDASKADLTLNLYARYKALRYVQEKNVPYCKCAIACCIGKSQIEVWLYDENNRLLDAYTENKKPSELIELFALRRPVFAKICREGLLYV